MYEIDSYDKRLLYELDKNAAASLSELSRKMRRSKQFILYRMGRLEKEGVIKGYNAIVDMSKLGYFTFRVYLKLQHMTREDCEQFVSYVRDKIAQVWAITSMHGKWDYALFLGVKTISEFHAIWDSIIFNYKEHIKSYNVAVYAPIYNFNRRFFIEHSSEVVERVYGAGSLEAIDELDWRIIELFAGNVRQSSLEMAGKLKVSSDTVRARLRKLEAKKIICGYKLGLNLLPLGVASYRVDMQLLSTKRNKELFEFCKQHKNIYQINKTIGGSDFEIEAIVKDLNHLLEVIEEIKDRFKDVINDVEYFGFSTFHKLHFIPD